MDCQSPDDLIEIFIKYKKFFKNPQHALNILHNPFYAGHFQYQDEFILLPYVEPIISLEDYLKLQDFLTSCEQILQNAIERSANNGIIIPYCYICKQPMSFRSTQLGESGNYVCSKKHPKIRMEVILFNQLISEHIMEILKKIQVKEIEKDVFNHLSQLEKLYKQELAFLQNQLNSTHRKMTDLIGSNQTTMLKKLINQQKCIEEGMICLDTLLQKIDNTRRGIDTFASVVKKRVTDELQDYQIEYLSKLLFSRIEVSSDALIYHTLFGNYIEGNDLSNDY